MIDIELRFRFCAVSHQSLAPTLRLLSPTRQQQEQRLLYLPPPPRDLPAPSAGRRASPALSLSLCLFIFSQADLGLPLSHGRFQDGTLCLSCQRASSKFGLVLRPSVRTVLLWKP